MARTDRTSKVRALEDEDPGDLAAAVARLLRQRGFRIATAESCTGGRIAESLTGVEDAAEFFAGGVVAYSVEAKIQLLGLHPSLLKSEGTVNERVAAAMAKSIRDKLRSDVGLAVTGVVGQATEGKPPGLIYACVAVQDRIVVRDRRGDNGPEANLQAGVVLGLRACLETLSAAAVHRA
jgi:PncC family amidohydrolase